MGDRQGQSGDDSHGHPGVQSAGVKGFRNVSAGAFASFQRTLRDGVQGGFLCWRRASCQGPAGTERVSLPHSLPASNVPHWLSGMSPEAARLVQSQWVQASWSLTIASSAHSIRKQLGGQGLAPLRVTSKVPGFSLSPVACALGEPLPNSFVQITNIATRLPHQTLPMIFESPWSKSMMPAEMVHSALTNFLNLLAARTNSWPTASKQ